MTAKIEQIVNSRVYSQEMPGLLRRFESTHDPFSNSCWLMRKLCLVIGILRRIMNRIWDEVSVRDTNTATRHIESSLAGIGIVCTSLILSFRNYGGMSVNLAVPSEQQLRDQLSRSNVMVLTSYLFKPSELRRTT